jgi:hypothetical protein
MKKKSDDNIEDDAQDTPDEASVTNDEESIKSRQRAHAAKIAEILGGK